MDADGRQHQPSLRSPLFSLSTEHRAARQESGEAAQVRTVRWHRCFPGHQTVIAHGLVPSVEPACRRYHVRREICRLPRLSAADSGCQVHTSGFNTFCPSLRPGALFSSFEASLRPSLSQSMAPIVLRFGAYDARA